MKLPSSIKNWVSISGAVLAVFNLATIFSLVILNWIFNFGGTYIGLFIYIVLPVFMMVGLLMIPIGMRLSRKAVLEAERKGEKRNWPVVDFNQITTRNAAIIFVFGTMILLIISSIGSYEAFHYTESVEFCGKLCHKVMEPEYTTYHGSSHERVACVECHVGAGASWYVKSKLSGLYQVYSVLAKKYPQPIPTPISNLRPARETCEQCHWPAKFYDRKLRIRQSFLADDQNTSFNVNLLVKTSSKMTEKGFERGIHQHISPDVKIEYKTTSPNRQVIPWVRYTNTKTGETQIFTDSENRLPQSKLDSLETRVMDCLDCHNRPSHNYKTPQGFVDQSLSDGKIASDLPGIKQIAMKILYKDYSTKDSAFLAIRNGVTDFYKTSHPDVLTGRKADVEAAIAEIQDGYSKNVFPFMKSSWKSYPNNIGHMVTDGCFRCHNDRHSTDKGKVISKDCNLCHSILAQGNPGKMEYSTSMEPLEFKHPVDIDDAWKTEMCSSCHAQLY